MGRTTSVAVAVAYVLVRRPARRMYTARYPQSKLRSEVLTDAVETKELVAGT